LRQENRFRVVRRSRLLLYTLEKATIILCPTNRLQVILTG